jgi:hypothetical protein
MQIVQKLPANNKIRSLTELMMPLLMAVQGEDQQNEYLIVTQEDFIQFLLGEGPENLGLQIEENNIICLLNMLVQEKSLDENEDESDA